MRVSAYFRVHMWRFRDVSMTDRGLQTVRTKIVQIVWFTVR